MLSPDPQEWTAVYGPVKSTGGERTLYRSDWAYIERTADGQGRQSWARKTRTGKLFDSMLGEIQSLRERVAQLEADKVELVNGLAEVVGVLRSEAPGTPLNNQKYDGLGIKCIELINKHKEPSKELYDIYGCADAD